MLSIDIANIQRVRWQALCARLSPSFNWSISMLSTALSSLGLLSSLGNGSSVTSFLGDILGNFSSVF